MDQLVIGLYASSGIRLNHLRFPITIFESLLVILATIALVQYRKIRATNSTLMTTLLRDSILYYARSVLMFFAHNSVTHSP